MKKTTLQSISFLLAGVLISSACTEEKTGKSPAKIADKIEVELKDVVQDSVPPVDSIIEAFVTPPAPPQPPMPPGPWPDPDPHPRPDPPEPWPEPEPIRPPLLPEPVPVQANPIVDFPDVEPEFIGGELELKKFIANNIQYPQIDLERENQGRVFVEFIVEKDGSLSNVKVLRGVSEGLDREARRVIRGMPNWKPGESSGQIVRCRARLPILFVME